MHVLVWLMSLKQINMDRIRASIPSDDRYVAYLVRLIFSGYITVKRLCPRNIIDILFIFYLTLSY